MSMQEVSWQDNPPDASARMIFVLSPTPGRTLRLLAVGSSVVGAWVHWYPDERAPSRGRNGPHYSDAERCPGCICQYARVPYWKAWLACWHLDHERYVIAQITGHAVYGCPALAPKSGVDLRGKQISLRRDGRTVNSPVTATVEVYPDPKIAVPADFDVRFALCRLWGVRTSPGLAWDDLEADRFARTKGT